MRVVPLYFDAPDVHPRFRARRKPFETSKRLTPFKGERGSPVTPLNNGFRRRRCRRRLRLKPPEVVVQGCGCSGVVVCLQAACIYIYIHIYIYIYIYIYIHTHTHIQEGGVRIYMSLFRGGGMPTGGLRRVKAAGGGGAAEDPDDLRRNTACEDRIGTGRRPQRLA